MTGDMSTDSAKVKLLVQEEGLTHLHDDDMWEMCKTDGKEARSSLDPPSLSNLLHTTYTILLLSSLKVNTFEAKTWKLQDQSTVKCATSKTAKCSTVW